MKILSLIAVLTWLQMPLATASIIPQKTIMDPTTAREMVPGDNPAYYTREKKADQLFSISEFIVSPNPPVMYKRVFFYLRGAVMREYPDLANSTLKIRAEFSNDDYVFEMEDKISENKVVTVRHGHQYGGPLTYGPNEIVGDLPFGRLGGGDEEVELKIEVMARLPDKRVLFAFEGKVIMT